MSGTTGDRELVLGRIRAAQLAAGVKGRPRSMAGGREYAGVLPYVGADEGAMLERFGEQCARLRVKLVEVADMEGAREALTEFAGRLGWRRVATDGEVMAVPAGVELLDVSGGYERREMERCDASVTGCLCLIAQTGSVVVTSRQTGGRALTVLPPHHVVVATRSQLVADMPAGYAVLEREFKERPYSFASLITGPSRTGDIERILVLGAHGPKDLTVVVVG